MNFSDNWRGWENCDVPLCNTGHTQENNPEIDTAFQTTKRIHKTSTKSAVLTTKVEISSTTSSTITTTTRTTTTTIKTTTTTIKTTTTHSPPSKVCAYQRKICTHGKNALIKSIEKKSDCKCIESCRKTDGCKYVAILKTKCRLFKENCAPEKRRLPTKFVTIDECEETEVKKCKPRHKRCKNISGDEIFNCRLTISIVTSRIFNIYLKSYLVGLFGSLF